MVNTETKVWPTHQVTRGDVTRDEPWYGDQSFEELRGAIAAYLAGVWRPYQASI